jgi:hypothetical protein
LEVFQWKRRKTKKKKISNLQMAHQYQKFIRDEFGWKELTIAERMKRRIK